MGQVGGGIGGGGNSPFEAKADFNNRRNFSKNLASGTIRHPKNTTFWGCCSIAFLLDSKVFCLILEW